MDGYYVAAAVGDDDDDGDFASSVAKDPNDIRVVRKFHSNPFSNIHSYQAAAPVRQNLAVPEAVDRVHDAVDAAVDPRWKFPEWTFSYPLPSDSSAPKSSTISV